MKNILDNLEEMKLFIYSKQEQYKDLDPLNKFSYNYTKNILSVLTKIKEEFNTKKINYEIFYFLDLFKLILVNSFENDFYKNNNIVPEYLFSLRDFILTEQNRKELCYLFTFFSPQNKRELKLLKEISSELYDYDSIVDLMYLSNSTTSSSLEKENVDNNIKYIYQYNLKNNSHSLSYLYNFVCFVNNFYKDKYPLYDSLVNIEDNKQHVFFKKLI